MKLFFITSAKLDMLSFATFALFSIHRFVISYIHVKLFVESMFITVAYKNLYSKPWAVFLQIRN